MPLNLSRRQYAEMFGPTVGDRVRLIPVRHNVHAALHAHAVVDDQGGILDLGSVEGRRAHDILLRDKNAVTAVRAAAHDPVHLNKVSTVGR